MILQDKMLNFSYKRIVFILFGLSFSFILLGQSIPNLDSLEKLDFEKIPDSVALEVFNKLAIELNDTQLKEKYAQLLLIKSDGYDPVWKFRAYLQLGNVKKSLGDFELALSHYFMALEIAKKMTYTQQAMINLTIADTYKRAENYSNAYSYYTDAKRVFENSNLPKRADSVHLAGIYTNLGDMFLIQEKYDSALRNFQKAKTFAELIKHDYYLAVIRGNIAIVYAALGLDESANVEILKSIEYLGKRGIWDTVAEFFIYMSDIYREKGNIDKAVEYAEKTHELALLHGLKKRIEQSSFRLYELMQAKGNYKSALEYHKEYAVYRDSLLNRETIQKMADQRTEFEVGQKQTEVDLLTAEKRTQKIIIFSTAGGALLVAILLGLVYKNYRDKNKINKILEDQKAQLERLNTTKDKFFSIISHDLRGPVHAFSGISRLIKYAVEDKNNDELIEIADHVDKTADDLSGLLDNLLNWALQQQGHFPNVPEKLCVEEMGKEINGIFSNMAKAKNINLSTSTPVNLELWADKNTSMTILRNLVNNAIKFTDIGGKVDLTSVADGDFAKITVSDTGVGIPQDKLNRLFKMDGNKTSYGTAGEKGLGLGLQLVYEFVEMNKGTIQVESNEGEGTKFIVRLPLFEAVEKSVDA
jgi:two-component system, NtrC family, sensor kinase